MGNVKPPTYPLDEIDDCACDVTPDDPSGGFDGCCCNAPSVVVYTVPIGDMDYSKLKGKPAIEGVELVRDHEVSEFGFGIVTDSQIDSLFG